LNNNCKIGEKMKKKIPRRLETNIQGKNKIKKEKEK
jgi:hypothetical protein